MPRQRHREWEPLFKSLLCPVLTEAGAEVKSSVRVGARELEIDLEVRCDDAARARLAETTPFDFFVDVNLIEAKLMDDRLTVPEFQRAMGRAWLYLSNNDDLSLTQVQTAALCSRHPRALLRWLSAGPGFDKISEGHYLTKTPLAFHILSLGRLPLESRNILLALFTVGERRQEVLKLLIDQGATIHLRAAYELYPQDLKEAIDMAGSRFSLEENMKFIVEDYGREKTLDLFTTDELLARIPTEKVLERIPPEEMLRRIPAQQRLSGIPPEERVKGLTPSELARLRRLLDGVGE
jgi:hypothetical protein